MAKRTRGSNRPGQRRPDRHAPARPQARPEPRSSGSLSATEEARAAELESQIVARERDAEVSRARSRERGRGEVARPGRPGGQGLLAARAAEEYAYVVRDVRRIIVVGGSIIAAMVVLFIVIDVLHLVNIS